MRLTELLTYDKLRKIFRKILRKFCN